MLLYCVIKHLKLKDELIVIRPNIPIVPVKYPCPGKPDVEIIAYGTAVHIYPEDFVDVIKDNGLGGLGCSKYTEIKLKVKGYCQDDKKIMFNLDE